MEDVPDSVDRTAGEEPWEPAGSSLKAAYLLLREINKSPESLSIEHLARILQDTLQYSYLIALVEDGHGLIQAGCEFEGLEEDFRNLHDWVAKAL